MHRTNFAALALVGLVATIPMARSSSAAVLSSRREVVPLQMDAGRIRDLQNKLDRQGFSAGEIDGLWGPKTAAALRRFQAAKGLQATGRFDRPTLAVLDSAGSGPASKSAAVPVTAPPAAAAPKSDASAPATTPSTPRSSPEATVDRTLGTNATEPKPSGSGKDTDAAGGNNNQAVVTTSANASQPAPGANSFSKGEAATRIAARGFQGVSDLNKDSSGVWRGTATKNGRPVRVWLDYKGNVGQQ